MRRSPSDRFRGSAWLLAMAGATVTVVVIATRFGIGVSTDSVAYIAEARQLAGGEGLTLPSGLLDIYAEADPTREAATSAHFPPLYPVVIAMAGLADDGVSSFRWLNALLLAATAVAVAVMVERHTGSRWAACLAAGVIVLSPAMLRVHSMAWSEPLLVALGFWGLLALAAYLEERRLRLLVAGSLGLGLAWLTRHIGIAFVLTGLVVLLVDRRRVTHRHLALFAAVSALPTALFLGGMALAGPGGGGFTLGLEAPGASEVRIGVDALRDWARPVLRSSLWGVPLLAPTVALVYLALRRGARNPSGAREHRLPRLPALLGTFLVVYAGMLLVSLSVFAEHLPLEERYLVPLFVAAVALFACVAGAVEGERRGGRHVLMAVAAVGITATAVAGTAALDAGTRGSRGFAARAWQQSEGVAQVARLPRSTRVWSNYPEAIHFTTGREARLLPKERLPGGRHPRHRAAKFAQLRDEVRAGQGVVVFFTNARRDLLPEPAELTALLGAPDHLTDALVYRRR